MKSHFLTVVVLFCALAQAAIAGEYLVRFKTADVNTLQGFAAKHGGRLELVSREGSLYKWITDSQALSTWDATVEYIAPNKMVRIPSNPSIENQKDAILNRLNGFSLNGPAFKDNPDIVKPGVETAGADPMLAQSWGLGKIGAQTGWTKFAQGKGIIVAVTDTGVDYNHTDLINNMWRNPNEVEGDGIDNDNNGYVDDMVGWDFAANDNKPYDLSLSLMDILLKGGNPGHGTHVAGVIGARLNNANGVAGVAPQAQIMAMRFITENGEGSTDAAIKAIDYAVANGAKIINASWGGEAGAEDDQPLIDAIQRAHDKGVIFVAAAGNGRMNPATGGAGGFDNDTDPKPMVPASYTLDNIMAVAALNSEDALADFSNWGHKSVDIGAPGVKILSTVPGNRYQDTVVDLGSIKATWDGTSMASPFVAGALAAVWSSAPSKTWKEVYDSVLSNTVAIGALSGKVASGGRLDLNKIRE